MHECEDIKETLTDYINRRFGQGQSGEVALHLSGCAECRAEVAFLIKLRRVQNEGIAEAAAQVKDCAFEKLPPGEKKLRITDYLEPVYDTIRLTGQTLRFAKQFI